MAQVTAKAILARMHLAQTSEQLRAIIRESLAESGIPIVASVRGDVPECRRDPIDDALAWRCWRIAGPSLARHESDTSEKIDARAAIALGDVQWAQSATGLNRRETLDWAESDEPDPIKWLLSQEPLLAEARTSHMRVARWALRMMNSPRRREAMLSSRTTGDVEGSAVARLDELTPSDLCDSVSDTIENAMLRQCAEAWDGPNELAKRAGWESQLPTGVTRLVTFQELWTEGSEQRHCVGRSPTYAEGILAGHMEIFAVRASDGTRATALVERGRVTSCLAARNETASKACLALAETAASVARR